MSELPTGTVTFLLTDVEGSTRLWEEQPAEMAIAIEAHEIAARQIIDRHGGHLLLERGEGDSLFAVFAAPSSAVQAAVDLQRQMSQPFGGVTLRVRIGLHSGEAQARGTTYFGRAVNRAARIRSVAAGGQIVLSQAVREIAEPNLPSDIQLRDCGRHRLRDLLYAEQLYEVIHPDLAPVATPLRSLELHPHNLPVQLTSFVGRSEALRDTVAMVRDHRLVTLLGAGGCGKTRLSVQIGAEVLESFEDGVWLVEAAPLRDGAALIDETYRVLDIPFPSVGELAKGPPKESEQRRHALLILDNCEHLREEAARMTRNLVEQVSELHVLATSREALGLRGERVYPLKSMGLPPLGTPSELLEDFEASALFLERAAERDPNLDLNQAEADAVCQIVRVLDGIPLAIEQAASNIGFLSPRLILERLDEWMAQPTDYGEDADPRHRTLEAAIDWSFHLLSSEEQTLFLRLAIFAGGWDIAAAEVVCADDEISRGAVLQGMRSLIGKSLIIVDADSDAGRRFRFLEPIRQFAARRQPISVADLGELHARYYEAYAASLDSRLGGQDQASALEAADFDLANCRAALDFYFQFHPDRALPMAMSMRRIWLLRGHAGEGRRTIEGALDLAASDSPLRPQALNAVGGFAFVQGDQSAAETYFRAALDCYPSEPPNEVRTGILHNLGLVLAQRSAWEEAETFLRKCVAEMEALGASDGAAHARLSLAHVLLEEGRSDEAYEALAPLANDAKRDEVQGTVLHALILARAAEASLDLDLARACSLTLRAVLISRKLGSKSSASTALFVSAQLAERKGFLAEAAFLYSAAREFNKQSQSSYTARQLSAMALSEAKLKNLLQGEFDRQRTRGQRATLTHALEVAERSVTAEA